MANAGTLTVTLQAVSQKFTAGMQKASASLKMFRGAIGPVQAAIGGLSAGLLAARFTKVAGDLDMLADSAQSLGVSIKDLSSLQYAGVVKGIANDQLSGALDRLNRSSVMAADGNKRFGASFAKLGIDAGAFTKLDAEQKLFAFSDALGQIEDPAQRSAIALRLLGNNSADMMDLLSGGASGIKDMQKQADALGISVGNSAADLGKFNEELAKLGGMWKAAEMQIVIALAPGVMDALGIIRDVGAIANGGEVSRVQGGKNAIGPETYRGRNLTGNTERSAMMERYGLFGGLIGYMSGDDSAGALTPEEQSAHRRRLSRSRSPTAEEYYAKQIADAERRQQIMGQVSGLWDRGKSGLSSLGGYLPGASKALGMYMGQGGPSSIKSWFKSDADIAKEKEMQDRSKGLFSHFSRDMGENNLLKRGTREAWMAERKGAQDKEQINLLKGIEKACAELARRGVTLATLD